jgi:hypothetical protein
VRENRLRRVAERRGYRLLKSRRRDPEALDYGGYVLIDVQTNAVILGATPVGFSATLDNVEAYFREPRRKHRDDHGAVDRASAAGRPNGPRQDVAAAAGRTADRSPRGVKRSTGGSESRRHTGSRHRER